MKYLLDTSIWLWSLTDSARIRPEARDLIIRGEEELYLSAASSWEVAIKWAKGKLPLPDPPEMYVPKRMSEQRIMALPITHSHTLAVSKIPAHHGDPFDRLLIAQARAEGMAILTADQVFRHYDVKIVWCGS